MGVASAGVLTFSGIILNGKAKLDIDPGSSSDGKRPLYVTSQEDFKSAFWSDAQVQQNLNEINKDK